MTMKERIFDAEKTNINAIALVVPTEEGATEDDRWNGSIGDATTKHISALSEGERQLWEGLIVARNGGIFRTEPSTDQFDSDPMNLRGEDLDDFLSREISKRELALGRKYIPTEGELLVLREIEEEERARRGESEDAYDRADTIPYSQMEQYPGMEKHIEMPRTPRDRLQYMGNTTQMFYDFFPEGHPNEKIINSALMILNRDIEDLDEGFIGWFDGWIKQQPVKGYVATELSNLAHKLLISSVDHCRAAEEALTTIDDKWREEYQEQAEKRASKDIFLQMIRKNKAIWEEEAKKGIPVLKKVKAFGSVLFKEYRAHMKGHHWDLYRKIRDEHAPRVMIRGVDINRCDMGKLRELFKCPASKRMDVARNVWLDRPFFHVSEVREKGYLTAKVFIDEDPAQPLVEGLDKFFEMSVENNSLKPLEAFRSQLIRAQRDKLINGLSNWTPIWAYYRLLRAELDALFSQKEASDEQGTSGQIQEQVA